MNHYLLILYAAPLICSPTTPPITRRIPNPIFLRLTITAIEPGKSGNSGKLGRRFQLINQRGEVVQEGESDVLVLTRQGAQARKSQHGQPAVSGDHAASA